MRSQYFKTNSKRKLKGILSSEQLKKIKIDFPDSQLVKNSWDSFQIIIEIQPTAISEKYQILVNYEKNRSIRVFVIEKDLKIASNIYKYLFKSLISILLNKYPKIKLLNHKIILYSLF